MMFLKGLFSLFIVFSGCQGVSKRWTRTWDLDHPDNWEGRNLPCKGKVSLLPHRTSTPVFLGDRLTTSSLELPVEGEVIFGNGANLVLDESFQEDCQDTKWVHTGHDSWYDPDSWEYPHFDDPASSPVPHIHRVPCTRDDVYFTNPNQSLYMVHLSPPAISISTMNIGNKQYSTSELASYARSKEGSFRFVGVSSKTDDAPLYVERPSECTDITGCLCGTEAATFKICRIMKSRCPEADCENPIEMKGFCCKTCGAEVLIAHNGSLPLADVQNFVRDYKQDPGAQFLNIHSAKMDDNLYHVYFTAMNDKGDYRSASLAFQIKFEKELSAGGQHTTLLAYSGKQTHKSRKGPSAHSVAAAFITLAICLAIGMAVYYLRKRRVTTRLSFMFRRLESSSRRVSVISDVGGRRLSTSSSVLVPSYNREGGLRFLNPIFNQSMASLVGAGLSERHPSVPEDQEEGEHENPMYAAYENMSPEERQASEDTMRARDIGSEDLATDEQDVIVHLPTKSDLDTIVEEKLESTESTDKETASKPPLDETVLSETAEPNKESVDSSDVKVTGNNTEPILDFDENAKGNETSDILGGDIFDPLATSNSNSQQTSETISHVNGDSNITTVTLSSISESSSDESIDDSLTMEGFTPLQDLGNQN